MENGEVQEPSEETKKLWDLYAKTAGVLQACVEHKYKANQCKTAVEALQKEWTEIYGDEFMQNSMERFMNYIFFVMLRG